LRKGNVYRILLNLQLNYASDKRQAQCCGQIRGDEISIRHAVAPQSTHLIVAANPEARELVWIGVEEG